MMRAFSPLEFRAEWDLGRARSNKLLGGGGGDGLLDCVDHAEPSVDAIGVARAEQHAHALFRHVQGFAPVDIDQFGGGVFAGWPGHGLGRDAENVGGELRLKNYWTLSTGLAKG